MSQARRALIKYAQLLGLVELAFQQTQAFQKRAG